MVSLNKVQSQGQNIWVIFAAGQRIVSGRHQGWFWLFFLKNCIYINLRLFSRLSVVDEKNPNEQNEQCSPHTGHQPVIPFLKKKKRFKYWESTVLARSIAHLPAAKGQTYSFYEKTHRTTGARSDCSRPGPCGWGMVKVDNELGFIRYNSRRLEWIIFRR